MQLLQLLSKKYRMRRFKDVLDAADTDFSAGTEFSDV